MALGRELLLSADITHSGSRFGSGSSLDPWIQDLCMLPHLFKHHSPNMDMAYCACWKRLVCSTDSPAKTSVMSLSHEATYSDLWSASRVRSPEHAENFVDTVGRQRIRGAECFRHRTIRALKNTCDSIEQSANNGPHADRIAPLNSLQRRMVMPASEHFFSFSSADYQSLRTHLGRPGTAVHPSQLSLGMVNRRRSTTRLQ